VANAFAYFNYIFRFRSEPFTRAKSLCAVRCTTMVQTVQAYRSARGYANDGPLFHKLLNTFVEKFIAHSNPTCTF
jgi:hypothetical protein